MDDATLDLILQGAGIDPNSPQGQTYKAALRAQTAALASTQGEDSRRWDLSFGAQQEQFGTQQQLARDKLDQDYKIAKMSAKTAAESLAVDRWYKGETLKLDQQRVDISRGEQGLGILKTGVDLNSSVANWAKLADWEAGVAANPYAVGSINRLLENTGATAGGNAPRMHEPVGMPEQNSLAATLGRYGAGSAGSDQTNALMSTAAGGTTPSTAAAGAGSGAAADNDPRTDGIQAIMKKWTPSGTEGWDPKDIATIQAITGLAGMGDHKYANRFAQLDENDQQMILGGMGRIGRDPAQVARNLERYRVGNQASGRAV